MINEYKTPEDLLDFVLIECSTVTRYDLDVTATLDRLWIFTSNLDIERIYYAIKLLKEYFDITIKELDLSNCDVTEIQEGYLENTQIEKLCLEENRLQKLPKLPDTLRVLLIDDNELSVWPELPEKLEALRCYHNKFTEIGYLPNSLKFLNVDFEELKRSARENLELYSSIINFPGFDCVTVIKTQYVREYKYFIRRDRIGDKNSGYDIELK